MPGALQRLLLGEAIDDQSFAPYINDSVSGCISISVKMALRLDVPAMLSAIRRPVCLYHYQTSCKTPSSTVGFSPEFTLGLGIKAPPKSMPISDT